jgi:hypothetical protein
MFKGIVALGFLVLAMSGCGGEAGALPEPVVSYRFDAKVAVNPTMPVVKERVSFSLVVTSSSTAQVKTDIVLKVVNAANETMYESKWEEVLFHEGEVWNLSQGFLPGSNALNKAWTVQIVVKDHATGEVLYDQAAATLNFN